MGKAPATSPHRTNPSIRATVPLMPWTRYRRKVVSSQEDNQEEHRTPTTVDTTIDTIKRERKKKPWKAVVDNQKDGVSVSSVSGRPRPISPVPVPPTATGGKKKKKRQLPDSSHPSHDQNTSPKDVRSVEPTVLPSKHRSQSLLKQLMYKHETLSSSSRRSLWKPKLQRREEEEEEEERAYTTQERQHLKAQAALSPQIVPQAIPVSGPEEIEQEERLQPVHVESEASALQIFFPTPFPVELLSSSEFLRQNQIQLHQIVLEDFIMEPRVLHIECGDIVVWKISIETLGMIEHSLEMVYEQDEEENQNLIRTITPPLESGNMMAWRFQYKGRVHVQCTVYQTKGIVVVGGETKDNPILVTTDQFQNQTQNITTYTRKSKLKKKQRPIIVLKEEEEEDVSVFHPFLNHIQSVEQDVEVCRAVLSQLEDVAHANTNRSVIVIGDVECTLDTTDSIVQNQTESESTSDALDDFQMRIISMLRHSEALRFYHRTSFQQETSGFDAGAAYDFFKQRFSQIQQEDKKVLYSHCPESMNGSGVDILEVVHVLTQDPEMV